MDTADAAIRKTYPLNSEFPETVCFWHVISEIWTTSKPGQQGMGTRWNEICQGFWRWWIRCDLGFDGTSQFLHLLSLGNMMGIIFFHLVLLNSVAVQDAQKQCFDFACSQNNRHRSHCGTCLGRHHVAGSMAPGACTGTSWLCCQGIGGASCEANPGDLEMFFQLFSINTSL